MTSNEKLVRGFADLAYQGRNDWWRYGLSLVLLIVVSVAGIKAELWVYAQFGWHDAVELALGGHTGGSLADQMEAFAFVMLSIIVVLPLMAVLLPWLHRRPFSSFFTASPQFRLGLALRSFGALLGLLLLALGATFVLAPATLVPIGNIEAILVFAPLALVLIGLQSLTEEVLFRGYVLQGVGRLTQWKGLRLIVPAAVFTLAHAANPETGHDLVWALANYALAALYLGLLTLQADGLEASFGAHFATNVFAALIVGQTTSVSPGPTLWVDTAPDYRMSFFATVPMLALHYVLVFSLWGRR